MIAVNKLPVHTCAMEQNHQSQTIRSVKMEEGARPSLFLVAQIDVPLDVLPFLMVFPR
jgi:hypothetical protein